MKRLQKALSSMLAVILLFSMIPVYPQAQAAEIVELPDTLTPEMAKAYADKLHDSYGSVAIILIGEERYPALVLGNDVWAYDSQSGECVKGQGRPIKSEDIFFLYIYSYDPPWPFYIRLDDYSNPGIIEDLGLELSLRRSPARA